MKNKERKKRFNQDVSDLKCNEQLSCIWDNYFGVGCKFEDNRKCEGCEYNKA